MDTWRVSFYYGSKCRGFKYVRACCRADALAKGIDYWCEECGMRMPTRLTAVKI